jgi:hypothetical protein
MVSDEVATALFTAIKKNDITWVKNYIKKGGKLNFLYTNLNGPLKLLETRPLFYAVQNGTLEMVKLLVENGASIYSKDSDSNSAISYAINKIDIEGNSTALIYTYKLHYLLSKCKKGCRWGIGSERYMYYTGDAIIEVSTFYNPVVYDLKNINQKAKNSSTKNSIFNRDNVIDIIISEPLKNTNLTGKNESELLKFSIERNKNKITKKQKRFQPFASYAYYDWYNFQQFWQHPSYIYIYIK